MQAIIYVMQILNYVYKESIIYIIYYYLLNYGLQCSHAFSIKFYGFISNKYNNNNN